MKRKRICLLFFAIISILCTKNINAQIDTLIVDTLTREYIKHVPVTYNPDQPIPLLIALHHAGGNASDFEKMMNLDKKADEEGFIVAYPDGTGDCWNAGACCGSAMENDIDDVGFISDLIDSLFKSYNIDTTKIFVAGFSNGSIMAYRLAAELSTKIKGIAAISGQMMLDDINPVNPVPIIHFHALDDNSVPFNGGNASGYTFPSVISVLDTWIEINNCSTDFETIYDQVGVTGKRWLSNDNANIILYTTPTGGHSWPTKLISATDLLWEFFTTGNAIAPDPEPTGIMELSSNTLLKSFQCYPNPFSALATISFILDQDQHVQLDVYNVYGKLIKTLINRPLTAGSHTIFFENNGELNDGIYILKFTVGNTLLTRKITVL